MNVNEVFQHESRWLKAADLQKKEHEVVIENITLEEFDRDGKKERKLGLHFAGKQLGLVANKTNSDTISYIYGPETDAWIGKTIVLYPTMVDFGGRSVEAIRVRVPMEKAQSFQQAVAEADPDLDDVPF